MSLQMKTLWIDLLLLTLYCFPGSEPGNEQLIVPESYQCACSDSTLTFNCTTIGSGTTLWNGTAFNCQNRGNQIILLNGVFSSGGIGSSGICGDNIVAQGIKVDGNCYTSQLNLTVTSSRLNQTSIVCWYRSNQGLSTVGRAVLTILLNHYPPPNSLVVTNVSYEKITFSWNSMAPVCSSSDSIHYLITTSDCGDCPKTVTNTTATCNNLQPSTEIRECRFSVQIVVCRVIGNTNETVSQRIGVPTISKLAVVPHFMSSNQALHSLEGFSDSAITVPVNVTAYNVSFLSPSGTIISSKAIIIPCQYPNCPIDVLSLCSSSPSINFTVSAVNSFGQGPPSNINTIGCTNEVVKVEYNSTSCTVLCQFLMIDTSNKSCTIIRYGICQDMPTNSTSENVTLTNSSTSNIIILSLHLNPGMNCFQVKASINDTFSIIVEGSWNITEPAGAIMPDIAITAGVPSSIGLMVLIVLAVIIIVTVTICVYRKKKTAESKESNPDLEEEVHVNSSAIKLKKLSKKTANYEIIKIDVGSSDTSIKQCVTKKMGKFQRGCAFYEFTHEMECIIEDKEVIFMNVDNGQMFTPDPPLDHDRRGKVGLCGEKVTRPNLAPQNFRLFVQSMGSGKRHVSPGSYILYKIIRGTRKNKQQAAIQRPEMSIISWQEQFVRDEIVTSGTLKDNDLEADKVFLNIRMTPSLIKVVEDVIILINEDKKIKAVTGPSARNMIKDVDVQRNDKRTVFVFSRCFSDSEDLQLTKNTQIMHQNPNQEPATFHVLKVDEDQNNMQMLEFIKQKLIGDNEFVNGNAFYEFNETEDLLYYKEVLRVPNELELVIGTQVTLKSDIGYFYEISGTPGLDIEPPQGENYRVFLQSTSQGSRCLKANSLLLYKK